jgi:hypothetical protein
MPFITIVGARLSPDNCLFIILIVTLAVILIIAHAAGDHLSEVVIMDEYLFLSWLRRIGLRMKENF